MEVLLVQLQPPDAGLYSIPRTDCTENPSMREGGGRGERRERKNESHKTGGQIVIPPVEGREDREVISKK